MVNTEHTYVLAAWYTDIFQITLKFRKIVPPFHRQENQLSDDCFGSGSDYRHRHPERPHLGVQPTKIQ
jgi:hypothetical protein